MDNVARAGLVILDGAGLAPPTFDNAVTGETMPGLFGLASQFGSVGLNACGADVGIFPAMAGNSEVGHLTIGLGRVSEGSLKRIDAAFRDGTWESHAAWDDLSRDKPLHIVALLSDAGVHGHANTALQAARVASRKGFGDLWVHLALDGVDSPAGSAETLLPGFRSDLKRFAPAARIGIVMGRQWFMDRSGDYEITKVFVNALMSQTAHPTFEMKALADHLVNETEATFPPHQFERAKRIQPGDTTLLTAHRGDRARQAADCLASVSECLTLVTLCDNIPERRVLLPSVSLSGGLAELLDRNGIRPVRIAEKCKFPHVTYFFNGLTDSFGETAICIPSTHGGPQVRPEMEVDRAVAAAVSVMRDKRESAFVMNLANLDQVGHLGSIDLCKQAAKAVDQALMALVSQAREHGWSLLITADHGNAESMVDDQGRPFGSHTCNQVPLIVIPGDHSRPPRLAENLGLANIAATFAEMLGVNVRNSGLAMSAFHNAPAAAVSP